MPFLPVITTCHMHNQPFLKNLQVIEETGTDSDHFLVTSLIDVPSINTSVNKVVRKTIRNYRDIDTPSFKKDIKSSGCIENILQCLSCDEAIKQHHISLNDLIDRHAPPQEIFCNSKNNPWWNKACQEEL